MVAGGFYSPFYHLSLNHSYLHPLPTNSSFHNFKLNVSENIIEKGTNAVDSIFSFSQNDYFNLEPFPNQQILDSSKVKEFADNNFIFEENGRKFSKHVENTVGKGETARYEQFLLFQQCFQRTYTADT